MSVELIISDHHLRLSQNFKYCKIQSFEHDSCRSVWKQRCWLFLFKNSKVKSITIWSSNLSQSLLISEITLALKLIRIAENCFVLLLFAVKSLSQWLLSESKCFPTSDDKVDFTASEGPSDWYLGVKHALITHAFPLSELGIHHLRGN